MMEFRKDERIILAGILLVVIISMLVFAGVGYTVGQENGWQEGWDSGIQYQKSLPVKPCSCPIKLSSSFDAGKYPTLPVEVRDFSKTGSVLSQKTYDLEPGDMIELPSQCPRTVRQDVVSYGVIIKWRDV